MPGSVLLVGHAGGTVGVGVGVGAAVGCVVGPGRGVPPPPELPPPPPDRPPLEPPREPSESVGGDVGDGAAVGAVEDVGAGLTVDVGAGRGVAEGGAALSGSAAGAPNVQDVSAPTTRMVSSTAAARGDLTRSVFHRAHVTTWQAGEMRSHHVSRIIAARPERVYAYASDVDNLPLWAAGLATSDVARDGDDLIVESPMGQVRVRFVANNTLGVLDHDVMLPSGTVVTNPLRVIAHPDGSEVIFTVRQIELTDEEFARDIGMVEADLERLAAQVTSPPA